MALSHVSRWNLPCQWIVRISWAPDRVSDARDQRLSPKAVPNVVIIQAPDRCKRSVYGQRPQQHSVSMFLCSAFVESSMCETTEWFHEYQIRCREETWGVRPRKRGAICTRTRSRRTTAAYERFKPAACSVCRSPDTQRIRFECNGLSKGNGAERTGTEQGPPRDDCQQRRSCSSFTGRQTL